MGTRINKVVTRTGDEGLTGLSTGQRLSKNAPRIHSMGEIDELNAHIGVLSCQDVGTEISSLLMHVQHDLFDLGAELSLIDRPLLGREHIDYLEQQIDVLSRELQPLQEFILPGGGLAAAQCHVVRTVCRRAERHCTGLAENGELNPLSLVYLNRLSDLFFILSRRLAARSGHGEVYWQSRYSRIKPDQ
jgi:cob(I)alamin adenosyltransferase